VTAVQTAILMVVTFVIDAMLFASHAPFWAAAGVTVGMFLGADIYHQHHAQGGHEDDDA
jgi:hypothetical protein